MTKFIYMLRIQREDQEKYQLLANELNKLAVKNKFSVDEIYEYSNSSIKEIAVC